MYSCVKQNTSTFSIFSAQTWRQDTSGRTIPRQHQSFQIDGKTCSSTSPQVYTELRKEFQNVSCFGNGGISRLLCLFSFANNGPVWRAASTARSDKCTLAFAEINCISQTLFDLDKHTRMSKHIGLSITTKSALELGRWVIKNTWGFMGERCPTYVV